VRGEGAQKEGLIGPRGVGKGEYTGAKLKVYSCFSRARGLLSVTLFFY
jgi:hypothetical protein